MIVVEKHASAHSQIQVELDYKCSSCGVLSSAMVTGRGFSHQSRSVFEMGENVSSDAKFDADVEAQRDAAQLMRIAACPKCHRRDSAEVRKLIVGTIWPPLIIGLVTEVVGYGLGSDRTTWFTPLPYALGLLALSALILLAQTLRRWRGSTRRVRFLQPT